MPFQAGTKHLRFKHGHATKNPRSSLYRIWGHMKNRCANQNDSAFADYGGRGISMCSEWSNDFLAFHEWAIRSGYEPGLSIDRWPDNDGDYEPGNCRWATAGQQANNRRQRGPNKRPYVRQSWPIVKLSKSQAIEIIDKRSAGIGTRMLAREYGVDRTTIQRIVAGRIWKSLQHEALEAL